MVPETQDPNIRELLHQEYRINYDLKGERSEIVTIVHGSRDVKRLPTPPWSVGE